MPRSLNFSKIAIFSRYKKSLKHPSWEFKGNLGNPDKNRHGTSAGAGTLGFPRIELRKLEAETLEDETRRLQDEKEERVKRLETLNAQAGNIFFGGFFFLRGCWMLDVYVSFVWGLLRQTMMLSGEAKTALTELCEI